MLFRVRSGSADQEFYVRPTDILCLRSSMDDGYRLWNWIHECKNRPLMFLGTSTINIHGIWFDKEKRYFYRWRSTVNLFPWTLGIAVIAAIKLRPLSYSNFRNLESLNHMYFVPLLHVWLHLDILFNFIRNDVRQSQRNRLWSTVLWIIMLKTQLWETIAWRRPISEFLVLCCNDKII